MPSHSTTIARVSSNFASTIVLENFEDPTHIRGYPPGEDVLLNMVVPVAETAADFGSGHYMKFWVIGTMYIYYIWQANDRVRFSSDGWKQDAWPVPGESHVGTSLMFKFGADFGLNVIPNPG